MTLAALNMLAFAWHTVLDLLEPPWRKAREAAEKRMSFFAYLVTLTSFVVFPAWSDLLEALATFTIPPEPPQNPKNRIATQSHGRLLELLSTRPLAAAEGHNRERDTQTTTWKNNPTVVVPSPQSGCKYLGINT